MGGGTSHCDLYARTIARTSGRAFHRTSVSRLTPSASATVSSESRWCQIRAAARSKVCRSGPLRIWAICAQTWTSMDVLTSNQREWRASGLLPLGIRTHRHDAAPNRPVNSLARLPKTSARITAPTCHEYGYLSNHHASLGRVPRQPLDNSFEPACHQQYNGPLSMSRNTDIVLLGTIQSSGERCDHPIGWEGLLPTRRQRLPDARDPICHHNHEVSR